MKRRSLWFLSACTLIASGCASVRRDEGLADVQQAISERARQRVEWRSEPSTAADERVRAMLDGELTADEAVSIAIMNNSRLQAMLAEVGIARADLIEASTIRNPLLEVEIRFPADPYRPFEVRLAQSLVDLIQLPRRRALGRAVFDASKLRVTSEILRFAGDVRARYYELLAATQQVGMSRTVLESAKAGTEVAQRQHEVQNITDLDLENEQALYEQAKLDLARAEQGLLLAREALLRAMALREVSAPWRLPDNFPPLPDSEPDQQQLQQIASTRRLDLEIARREVDIARQQVPLARLAAIGEIEGDIHVQQEPDGVRTTGPGIEFPIPIFNTGAAARSRAEARFLQARHLLSALLAESASELRTATATVAEARARVEYYRDVLLPRRSRIVELTKLEHNAMLVGVFQLLQAKQNEAEARRDSIEAQRDYWSARNDLDRALNGVANEPTFMSAAAQNPARPARRQGGH